MPAALLTKILFSATLGLAGFLLFQVQPVLAKFILPWFGGSATTWTVCMLFFQLALLAGYGYAYALTAPIRPRTQALLHIGLLGLALLALPITPSDAYKPDNADNPLGRIMALLTVCVGLPYMVLSTTSPLLQRWLAQIDRSLLASRFFAVSNLGSFLGLLSYPFIFEPLLSSPEQTIGWSRLFVVFALLMAGCAAIVLMRANPPATMSEMADASAAPAASDRFWLWLVYSGLGSVLLIATTNQMTQWTAVIPFLWILPLSLYLATFIIAFGYQHLYHRLGFFIGFVLLAVASVGLVPSDPGEGLLLRLAFNAATMTAGCMICHAEMVRLQPPATRLPRFYMAISLGGALGGIAVALIAPLIFSDYWEYPLALIATTVMGAALSWRSLEPGARGQRLALIASCASAIAGAGYALSQTAHSERDVVDRIRNFYGVVKIIREHQDEPERFSLTMVQAGVPQGSQYQIPARRNEPYCAFLPGSGVGHALAALRARPAASKMPLRIGSVGLGVGVLAALGQPGDDMRVYELNPAVTDLTNRHFSFVRDSKAKVQVFHGDGRILLERELAAGTPGKFDLLVVDAFRGASPPLHLMTKEAFDIYLRHLAPGGILAINFEIDVFGLAPLHRGLSKEFSLNVGWFETPSASDDCDDTVSWALYTRDAALFAAPDIKSGLSQWRDDGKSTLLWTDANANLLSIVNWDNLIGRVAE